MVVAGAANGAMSLAAALREGDSAARAMFGLDDNDGALPGTSDEPTGIKPFWHVAQSRGRAWLDLQNDVTVKDVWLAHQEGFRSVEHMKRYTTLGMATDQGKTGSVVALAVLAETQGKTIAEVGTTIFRPPYTPVAIGAFAGHHRGRDFRPIRHTPGHTWASEFGASFVEAGLWLRADMFPRRGETHWRQTVDREVRETRANVGVCDVSTLGKIDIKGADSGIFLDRVYTNTFSTLAIGKVRYGLMLREDGLVFDDGTTARLGDNHYLMTTTTANAVAVFRHLEFCRQCLWPDLDIHFTSVTDHWAQFAVAGPKSRALLERLLDTGADISNDAFPFMACGTFSVGGVPVRLFRISFSGELAYEIAVAARFGDSLIRALMKAGEDLGVTAYGTEALGVMRVEKGHAAGAELNGQTTADDLGLGKMLSKKKDFIGRTLAQRPGLADDKRMQLVGFRPIDRAADLTAGAHFLEPGAAPTTANDQGWMSSVAYSPELGHMIGLGFLRSGRTRLGQTVRAWNPLRHNDVEVEVVSPHFIDPEGVRLRD
jgi:sarcosine oxidase subunit alpha